MNRYYESFAAAFIRGRAETTQTPALPPNWREPALADLDDDDLAGIIAAGSAAGLRLRKFKRAIELPRVRRVLGILQGLRPQTVLDIGSGRGTFLWPLLETFAELNVTAVDVDAQRFADLQCVRKGGVTRLTPEQMDATALGFADGAFDVVTMLEVLEHIPAAGTALAEVCRVARRFVVISVPSKADDNPEHIHLFDQDSLTQMLAACGVDRVRFEYVLGHVIAVANLTG